MFGISSFKADSDFRKVKKDVDWWFSANMKAVVERATRAKGAASESKVRLNAAQAYYAAIREIKLNQVEATKAGYTAMVDSQIAEKRLRGTKKALKQKLLEVSSTASKR